MSDLATLDLASDISCNDGHDAATARELIKRFRDAQNAGRRIMAFGLFAWEVKEEKLKHGQWGKWLARHAPSLCRPDSKTGELKPSSSLSTYMQMTKDVLNDMGFTIEKYFKHISNSQPLGICHSGKFLLLPEGKAKKLAPEAAQLRQEFCSRVDGKTAKQICWSFGQVEDDGSGELKRKRGRLKGHGGNSKEALAAAAEKEEASRINDLELEAEQIAKALDLNCDLNGYAKIEPKIFEQLRAAVTHAAAWMNALHKSRAR